MTRKQAHDNVTFHDLTRMQASTARAILSALTDYSVSAADWTTLSSVMRLVHTVEACDVRASWHGEGGGF
jgi:hypothetical protein